MAKNERIALENVRVRVQVSKTVQIPQYAPYQVQMSVEGDIAAKDMVGVQKVFDQMFTEVHNNVLDAIDAYVESVK